MDDCGSGSFVCWLNQMAVVLEHMLDTHTYTHIVGAQMHRGVARILSRVDEEARSATRALAGDMQWEYDDEYDDSFDDLLRTGEFVAAGVRVCIQVPHVGLGKYGREGDFDSHISEPLLSVLKEKYDPLLPTLVL
eukprot:scaffold8306_cov15-Tisochrysis_lutea.AAC.1